MDVQFKFGADPELFVVSKADGKPVSAFGMLEGTKEAPMAVEGGALQVDGMALEFNVDPFSNPSHAYKNVKRVIESLKMFVPEGYKLSADPVAEFGSHYLSFQPEEARELGCDPDFNAYTGGGANPTPNVEMPFRTGSGHVHIGWTTDADKMSDEHLEACIWLTKQLDYALAIPALTFGDPERMRTRRNLYGKAGAFRPKDYGVEYRVLDNYWLRSKAHINYVFAQTAFAVEGLMRGYHFFDKYMMGMSEEELQQIINDCDVDAARRVMEDSPIFKKFPLPRLYTGILLK